MKPKPKKPSKPSSPAKLRIIGGRWRGRQIYFNDAEGLRPTGDRIRETVFNWLAAYVPDSRCLDLFAGSGALGFEALSRGAAQVTMVESHRATAQMLRDNGARLDAQHLDIACTDAQNYLLGAAPQAPYDIVFIDPPFQLGLWQPVLDKLLRGGWLTPQSVVYVETPRDLPLALGDQFTAVKFKQTGQVDYGLWQPIAPQ